MMCDNLLYPKAGMADIKKDYNFYTAEYVVLYVKILYLT